MPRSARSSVARRPRTGERQAAVVRQQQAVDRAEQAVDRRELHDQPQPGQAALDALEQDPALMLGDWLADELWALHWPYNFSFAHARADLVTRAVIARDIARSREAEGARPDRAMAEAIRKNAAPKRAAFLTIVREACAKAP